MSLLVRHLRDVADSIESPTDEDIAHVLRQSDEMLQPGLAAIDTKQSKLIQLGAAYFMRLASHDAMDPSTFAAAGRALRAAAEGGDEQVQLRMLQAIMSIMQAPSLVVSKAPMLAMLECLFVLFSSRNQVIANTAAATLRQCIWSIFEFAAKGGEDRQRVEGVENGGGASAGEVREGGALGATGVCIAVFQELSHLMTGEASKSLNFRPAPTLDLLCMDVADAVIRSHAGVFRGDDHLCAVLRDMTCPFVISKLMQSAGQGGSKRDQGFQYSVRIVRIASAIVSNVGERLEAQVANILVMVEALLTKEGPIWQRQLALECIHEFCFQDGFAGRLRVVFTTWAGHGQEDRNGVVGICFALERTVQRCVGALLQNAAPPASIAQARATAEAVCASAGAARARALDALGHSGNDAPGGVVSDAACLGLTITCTCRLVSGVSELCGVEPRGDEEAFVLANKPQCDTAVMLQNVDVCRSLIDRTWPYFLASLQTIMVTVTAPPVLEEILRAYAAFTRTCGALQLVGPRDKALAPLCKSALPGNGHDGVQVPLRVQNILVLKTLLSLVFELGGVLGEAWWMVLEVLQRLDTALFERGLAPSYMANGRDGAKRTPNLQGSSRTPNLQGSSSVVPVGEWSEGRLEVELIRLRSGLDALFEQSCNLDEASVILLMQALCKVGLNSVSGNRPDIVGASKQLRMFGVDQLGQVVRHNLDRVGTLWEVATTLLYQVACHPRATVRQYGMDCLTPLIIVAFKHRSDAARKDLDESEELEHRMQALDARDDDMERRLLFAYDDDMERRLLSAYEELSRCQWADTKNNVLDGLYEVLQSCGEEVKAAWPMVLAMLKGVAQDMEAQQVQQAFMCLQLIRNDFLSALPVDCLQLLLTTIGSFGLADTDLNISLTAITLLWNIADFFGREREALLTAFSELGFHPEPRSASGNADAGHRLELQVHNVDQLWLVLYQQLRHLAVDPRIEVRNSALRTLFTALEAHGKVLEKSSWHQIVHELLLPVLDDVSSYSSSSGNDEPVEKALGYQSQDKQMMLIHHSRNTLSKQWYTTWETAFQGVARMVLTFFGIFSAMDSADQAWQMFLGHLQKAVVNGSDQVANSAVTCVVEILEKHISSKSFPKAFWDQFWSTVEEIAAGACENSNFSQGTLKHLVKTLVNLQGVPEADKLQRRENISSVLRMLDRLASTSFGAGGAAAGPTPLQSEVLEALRVLSASFQRRSGEEQVALWSELVSLLQAYLPGITVRYAWAKGFLNEKLERHPSPGMTPAAALLLAEVYRDHMPEDVQGRMLGHVAVGFLVCLCYKHQERQPQLWQPGVKGFTSTVGVGFRALNRESGLKSVSYVGVYSISLSQQQGI